MPLKHRTIHFSPDIEFANIAKKGFRDWLKSRRDIDLSLIGRDGELEPIGNNYKAKFDISGIGSPISYKYTAVVDSGFGEYTTMLTSTTTPEGTFIHTEVHAPRDDSQFQRPALTERILSKAIESNIEIFDRPQKGSGAICNRFTQAPQMIKVDQVGDLIDNVIENPDRTSLALVAGMSPFTDRSWRERLENWTSDTQGVGTLWVLDPDATEEFNRFAVPECSIHEESIHTFEPNCDIADSSSSQRHRWFSARDLIHSSVKYNRRRLYHLARVSALHQSVPLELKDASTDLSESAINAIIDRPNLQIPIGKNLVQRIDTRASSLTREPKSAGTQSPPRPLSPMAPTRPAEPSPAPEPFAPETQPSSIAARSREETEAFETIRLLLPELNVKLPSEWSLAERLQHVFSLAEENSKTNAIQHDENLKERYRNAERKIRELESSLDNAWTEFEDIVEENSSLQDDVADRQRVIRSFSQQLQIAKAPPEAWVIPEEIFPTSIEEILGKIKDFSFIKFTGDKNLAIDLDRRTNARTIARYCWHFLCTLEEYAAGWNDGPKSVHQFINDTQTLCPPNRHAPDETTTLKSNTSFNNARLLPVPSSVSNDKRAFMYAHYKLANDGGQAPRLHYLDCMDRERNEGGKMIYIGYIGKHLRSSKTN